MIKVVTAVAGIGVSMAASFGILMAAAAPPANAEVCIGQHMFPDARDFNYNCGGLVSDRDYNAIKYTYGFGGQPPWEYDMQHRYFNHRR